MHLCNVFKLTKINTSHERRRWEEKESKKSKRKESLYFLSKRRGLFYKGSGKDRPTQKGLVQTDMALKHGQS